MKLKLFALLAALSMFPALPGTAAPFVVPAAQATYSTTTYTIAAGKTFKSLKVPVQNVPILMMVTCTTISNSGVGSATLLRAVGSSGSVLEWSGTDGAEGATGNASNIPGTHIIYADFAKQVDIQLNTVDSIRIVNSSAGPVNVVVTLIY